MSKIYLGKAGTTFNQGGAPFRDAVAATKMATQHGGKVVKVGEGQYMVDMTNADQDVPRALRGRIDPTYMSLEQKEYYGLLQEKMSKPAPQAPPPPNPLTTGIGLNYSQASSPYTYTTGTPYAQAAPPKKQPRTVRKEDNLAEHGVDSDEYMEEYKRKLVIRANELAASQTIQSMQDLQFNPNVDSFERAAATKGLTRKRVLDNRGAVEASAIGRQLTEDAKITNLARRQNPKDASIINMWNAGKDERTVLAQQIRAKELSGYQDYKAQGKEDAKIDSLIRKESLAQAKKDLKGSSLIGQWNAGKLERSLMADEILRNEGLGKYAVKAADVKYDSEDALAKAIAGAGRTDVLSPLQESMRNTAYQRDDAIRKQAQKEAEQATKSRASDEAMYHKMLIQAEEGEDKRLNAGRVFNVNKAWKQAHSENDLRDKENRKIDSLAHREDVNMVKWNRQIREERKATLADEILRNEGLGKYAPKEGKVKGENKYDKFGRIMDTEVAEEFAYREDAKRAAKELEGLAKAAEKAAKEEDKASKESKKAAADRDRAMKKFGDGLEKAVMTPLKLLATLASGAIGIGVLASKNAERELFGAAATGTSRTQYASLINQLGMGTEHGGQLIGNASNTVMTALRTPDAIGGMLEQMVTANALTGGGALPVGDVVKSMLSGDQTSLMNQVRAWGQDKTAMQRTSVAGVMGLENLWLSKGGKLTGEGAIRTGTDAEALRISWDMQTAMANILGGDLQQGAEDLTSAAHHLDTIVTELSGGVKSALSSPAMGTAADTDRIADSFNTDKAYPWLKKILGTDTPKPKTSVAPLVTSPAEFDSIHNAIGSWIENQEGASVVDPRLTKMDRLFEAGMANPNMNLRGALAELKLDVAFETITLPSGETQVRPYLREQKVRKGS